MNPLWLLLIIPAAITVGVLVGWFVMGLLTHGRVLDLEETNRVLHEQNTRLRRGR